MKTTFLVALSLVFSFVSFSQVVGGDLAKDGRKLTTPSDFTMYESSVGEVYYTISVDINGKVTSAKINGNKSIKVSIPLDVRIYNYLMGPQFEPGTHFPKFHQGEVKLTLKKKEVKPQP
ncbi:MAG TPA: hypothetical protein PKN22_02580 [Taishania sp.]|nr:hypothetical protein [Taishania sp.]